MKRETFAQENGVTVGEPEGAESKAANAGDGAGMLAPGVLPRPEPTFKGTINRSYEQSMPDFPQPYRAPAGTPNVLLIMTDDVGFGASSTFGGPIPTSTFDKLAQHGIKYNRFHTTALCSPTRAALITGRNPHNANTGIIMERSLGFPGYNSVMSKSCGTVGEVLRQNGFNTAWFGKNHNVPDWQSSAVGPFDLWPTALGFEYFFGFIGGDANQWAPPAYEGTTPIDPQLEKPDYHFDSDMADRAVHWIQQQQSLDADKPFFLYYAPGAAHAPHHVPKAWIEKFKGKFDHGWDAQREITFESQKKLGIIPEDAQLTPRPDNLPSWDSQSAKQKELFAHMMEIYAAYLAFTDYNIGRVIDAVEQTGQLENTLIIYIQGDNGGSGEGTL
jgi:arylsulfatase A-like enzyme